ncbi:MAG TPA: peroxiredoxin [Xanthomonadaceae bacterium]|nr:peroxiredoxin [Xanthomonadaceae bacterium]
MPAIGRKVPAFKAVASGGKTLSLKDFAGTTLVLYFYPKDNTPGCTREAQDFRDRIDDFRAKGACVVGVSRDSVKSHDGFCSKQNLPFDLISDADEKLCQAFDVIRDKNMYGRVVRGIQRSTFVIDGQGVLRAEWRGIKVPGHVDEVLAAVESL